MAQRENPRDRKSGAKPFRAKRTGDRPFDKKRTGERPFKKREDDKPFKKKWDDKPFDKKRAGSDRSFRKRGDDKPFDKKRDYGDKPFRKRNDDKPFDKKRAGGGRPFRKRDDDKPFKKKWDDKPFDKKRTGGDRPFRKRDDDKSFERKSGARKPYDPGSRKYRTRPDTGSNRRYEKRAESGGKPDRESRPFKKRTEFRSGSGPARPWQKRPAGAPADRTRKRYKSDEPGRIALKAGEDENKKASFPQRDQHREKRRRRSSGDEKRAGAHTQPLPTEGPIRLNRYIAHAGICSRREADELIAAGLVTINGKIITELGTKVNPGDEVRYDNRLLNAERNVYVLLNKPKDYITTTDDPENRNTVMRLVEKACRERIYPVGRLDRNTTGLLLFTNDGDLARKLTHPSGNVSKIYHVELDRKLEHEDFQRIAEGMELDDGFIRVDEIAWAHPDDKMQVGLRIHSGKNRVVRRIFETLGYDIRKLDRVEFAGLTKKDLPRGRWRFLTEAEVNLLKMIRDSKSTPVAP